MTVRVIAAVVPPVSRTTRPRMTRSRAVESLARPTPMVIVSVAGAVQPSWGMGPLVSDEVPAEEQHL